MHVIDLDRIELEESSTAGGPIRVTFPFHGASGATATAGVLFELDPGDSLATHTDSAEELLLVLSGEAEVRIDDERKRVSAGQLAIVPASVPHGVGNPGPEMLRVLGVFSSSTVLATFDEPIAPDGPRLMLIGAPVNVLLSEAVPT
jgi:quercetin dioxygenase-like cupin family protein